MFTKANWLTCDSSTEGLTARYLYTFRDHMAVFDSPWMAEKLDLLSVTQLSVGTTSPRIHTTVSWSNETL